MRFMVIVKANKDSEAGVMPTEKLLADLNLLVRLLAKICDPSPNKDILRFAKRATECVTR